MTKCIKFSCGRAVLSFRKIYKYEKESIEMRCKTISQRQKLRGDTKSVFSSSSFRGSDCVCVCVGLVCAVVCHCSRHHGMKYFRHLPKFMCAR